LGPPSHQLVNEYGDRFETVFGRPALCDPAATAGAPAGYGFVSDPGLNNRDAKIDQKIDPLSAALANMNTVVEQGASIRFQRGHLVLPGPRTVHQAAVGAGHVRPGTLPPERRWRAQHAAVLTCLATRQATPA